MATRKRVRNHQPQPAEKPEVPVEDEPTGEDETHEETLDPEVADEPKLGDTERLPLDGFIRFQEDAAQLHGAVVVEVSHPDGTDRVYPGRDGGIRLTEGEQSARWSDGSKH